MMSLGCRMLCSAVAVVAAALACASPSWAATPSAATPAPPRAQLAQFACQHALDPANRTVSVQAVMRPLTGTQQLAVKFTLLERTPGAISATVVHGTGLGVWITPLNPTLGQLPGDVWHLDKNVLNLDAPATYRFHVEFRWTGAHGKVLGTAQRWSHSCTQRELRPDLAVESVSVSAIAGHPELDLYTALIANLGLTGAGPFEVLFTPGDSSAPKTDTIAFLGAGKTRQLSFTGPVCNASSPPTVTADATDEVDDLNRANNVASAVCPTTSSTPPPTTTPSSATPSSAQPGASSSR